MAEPLGQPSDFAFPNGAGMNLSKRDLNDPRLSPSIETRFSAKDGRGEIEGLAAGFGDALPDSYGDTISFGAFAASLAEHKARGTAPVMLWQHDTSEPIGVWTKLQESSQGLQVWGQINLDTQRGREALSLLKQGAFRGLSIGFTMKAAERRTDGGRRITAAELWEISLVTMPARREAQVAEVRSIRDLEAALRAGGLTRGAAALAARGGWPALAKKTDDSETLLELERMLRATAKTL